MSDKLYTIKESRLKAIADAIREVEGSSAQINSDDFADRIRALVKPDVPVVPELLSISATKVNTTYTVGDYLDTDDITVTAHYSDGSSNVVTGATFSTIDTSSAGTKTLTITYADKTTTILITVNSASGHPIVPQTGTWQIQDTVPKAYIMMGFDDDNPSIATDAYIVSTYGIPPIINTEAENVNKNLASVPEWSLTNPTSTDVNRKVVSIGGEVALHGGSGWRLWNSEAVTDEMWNTWHSTYVGNGGELNLAGFKSAFLNKYSGNDLTQNATMFLANRTVIENAIGSPVMTIGAWGGNGITNIDGHDVVNINQMPVNKAIVEAWARGNNFSANSQLVGYNFSDYPYYINRNVPDDSRQGSDAKAWIDRSINDYSVIEIFSHGSGNGTNPSVNTLRAICQYIKDKVDEGKCVAITRKGYAELGTFVDDAHLVVSLDCTIPIVKVGDVWTNPDIVATYKDGHTAVVNGSVIGTVDTTTAGTYSIVLYYHGIKTTKAVIVEADFNLPTFEPNVINYYIYQDTTDTNKMYCGAGSGAFTSLGVSGASAIAYTTSGTKVWNYVSVDGGLTWTAVCSNKTVYGNYKSTDSAWWGNSTFTYNSVQIFRGITNI